MSAIRRKLHSKSGISLAIALVFLLLCAMVGTVVLSAASVSAGKTARERLLYRQTLALTSAMDLLSQDIQNMTFTGQYIKKETMTTTIDQTENANAGERTTVTSTESFEEPTDENVHKLDKSGLFTTADDLNIQEIYLNNLRKRNEQTVEVKSVTQNLTFQAVEEQNIPQVLGELTVNPDYSITVILSCGKDSSMTAKFPPRISETAGETPAPTIKKTTGENGVSTSVRVTSSPYTTTVTWDAPQIKEGGTILETTAP